MKLPSMLKRWQAAGLIDDPTARSILAYESKSGANDGGRPLVFYALGGLGGLAIAIGLVSIVAANWDEIPATVKLFVDLALLSSLAAAVVKAAHRKEDKSARMWAHEILLFVYYGATLASIALVGQTYHLGGTTENALAAWSIVTFPICLRGESRLFLGTWIVALLATLYMNAWPFIESLHGDSQQMALTSALVGGASYALMAVGLSQGTLRNRPHLASVAWLFGSMQWLALTSVSSLFWYESPRLHGGGSRVNLAAFAVLAIGAALFAGYAARSSSPGQRRAVTSLLSFATLAGASALAFGHEKVAVAGALHFVVLWGLVAWAAFVFERYRLFNVATALIGVRLLVAYFEVFESLLTTGLGLISGGVLAIGGAWVWMRQTQKLKRMLGEVQR